METIVFVLKISDFFFFFKININSFLPKNLNHARKLVRSLKCGLLTVNSTLLRL